MIRLALLSGTLLLVSCGADGAAKTPSAPAPIAVTSNVPAFATMEGGARALATYQEAPEGAPALLSIGSELQAWSHGGEPVATPDLPEIPKPILLDIQGDELWLADKMQLQSLHLPSQTPGKVIAFPLPTTIAAIEAGYTGTAFVADGEGMRVLVASADNVEVLLEGPELGVPQALLLDGGSLLIGTRSKLLRFDIKSRESKVLATDLGSIVGLTHDHLGYFVVLTASGKIFQVQGDGTSRLLHTLQTPATGLAFDNRSRKLYLASDSGIAIRDYLDLTEEDKGLWSKRDQRLMRAYRKNGMTVAGGEFWPSHGTTNVSYPDDILWGFYPSPDEVIEGSAASVAPPAAAIACAESSYQALQAFVDSNPEKFHRAAEATNASKQFYLWVNDYSDAAKDFPHEQRPNKFWYWERKPAVRGRIPGFWKWETTLMQDGTCSWPQAEQIESFLDATLAGAK